MENSSENKENIPNDEKVVALVALESEDKKLKIIQLQDEEDSRMKRRKKITYDVPNVGTVIEEIEIESMSKCNKKEGKKSEKMAWHKVFVDDQLVRKVNLITNEVEQSDPKYEPWNFLHMDSSKVTKMLENPFFKLQ